MTDTNTNQPQKTMKSFDEIAASMISRPQPEKPKEKKQNPAADRQRGPAPQTAAEADPVRAVDVSDDSAGSGEIEDDVQQPVTHQQGGDEDESILDDLSDNDSDDESEGDTPSKTADSEDDDPLADLFDADDSRVSDAADTDQIDTSKLGDDVKLSVTVDGEDREVTLGELKKRYAGNGAIEKRLQEVTEARTAAVADYEKGRQLTEAVLQQFGQALFRRTVPEPDPSLLDSNPQAYMRQKMLYDNETTALVQSHQQLHAKMQEVDRLQEEQRKLRRAEASKKLREIMPVFKDPVKGPKVRQVIIDAAREIGFSDQMIAACEDPLLFKTMALAARELHRQKKLKVTDVKPKPAALPATGSRNRPVTPPQKRKETETINRARKTGTVDDVAMTLIAPKPKRGRR